MSKADGLKIGIKFTEDLVGNIDGLNPPVGYTYGTNDLSQGKAVTVGNASYGAGANAVDGNNGTYWGTYSTLPWWISIDLGEIKKSTGFYILQSNASYRAKDYVVLGSNDGTNFTQISTGQLENIAEQTIPYNASDYQYIRINFTSYWSSSRAYIYTLKILEAVPAGNELAFSITGKEYQYVNGSLLNKIYKPISVESHPTEPKSILITMDWWGRFNNVEDKIKVLYDASKGSLTGAGGAVESFEVQFTPEDLIQTPNPNEEELIKAYPYEIVLDLNELTFINAYSQEYVKAYPYEIVLELKHVSEINP
jgi:hypothetical protein